MSKFYTVTAFMLSETSSELLAADIRNKKVTHLTIDLNDVYPVTVTSSTDAAAIKKNITPFLERLLYENFDICSVELIAADDSKFTNKALGHPTVSNRFNAGLIKSASLTFFSTLVLLPSRVMLDAFFPEYANPINIGMLTIGFTSALAGSIHGALRGNGPSVECFRFNNAIKKLLNKTLYDFTVVSGLGLDKFKDNAYVTELITRQENVRVIRSTNTSSGDYNAYNQLGVPANTVSFVQSKGNNNHLVSSSPSQNTTSGYTYN